MKKFLKCMTLSVMTILALSSCTSAAKKVVELAVQEGNKQCPVTATADVTMTAMSVEGDYMVYEYLVHENIFTVDNIAQSMNEESFKQSFSLNPETKSLVQSLVSADMGLKARIKGERSKEVVENTYGPEKIKKWLTDIQTPDFDNSADEFLKTAMESSRSQCPIKIDANTILTDCYYDNKAAVYIYTIVENEILDMQVVKNNRDIFENMIRKNLSDQSQKSLIIFNQKVKDANAHYVYKYIGDTSQEEMEIIINPDEI